ncbi:MAG: hypothetical protein COV74_08645 [Candidatus Omnitrophica bacterium CG11_big_fil_rev_8_21_14_0_20_45_26]|uniref:DUF2079 domain-containing protein n=1 Tax=Candidatus Abzuiibacterium crystallinum TaxID=1974748 RepID=A0A2H0LMB2_9BACT|nr:MAG: hypothetical protein COV74_08645 [Candidatus Omnitrophica bacterium CG11_big_fil_rev_8_21_14_0_20_45_26]PIW63729.1 MAG: hypothetical protein COW12_09530 [Candidatus Omnitrophica bacterium CG12_big_fil_rev_8_21_14_0_65_45_16]
MQLTVKRNFLPLILKTFLVLCSIVFFCYVFFDARLIHKSAFRFSSATLIWLRLTILAYLIYGMSRGQFFARHRGFFWIIIAASFIWMLLTKWGQHLSFHTHSHDLGLFHSILWNAANGNGFVDAFKHQIYFSDHLIFFLALLAPFYKIHAGVGTLFLLTAVAFAATAVILSRLAEARIGDRSVAFILGAAFLLNRYVWGAFLHEFHPDFFAPFFFFALFLSIDRQNNILLFLSTLAVLSLKEDYALYLIPIGIYFILTHKNRRQGLWLVMAGMVYSWLAFRVLIPYFYGLAGKSGGYAYLGSWGHLGHGFSEVMATVISHPISVIQNLSGRTLFNFGVKCLFLPLVSPLTLIYILPPLFLNTVSSFPLIRHLSIHYGLIPVTLTYVGCVEALRFLKNKGLDRLTVLLACLLLIVGIGRYWIYWPQPESFLLSEHANSLKREKAICVQSSLFPHLIPKGDFSIFPECADEAQYLFLNPAASTYPLSEDDYRNTVDSISRGGRWVLDQRFGRSVLFKRKYSH